jgi:hypothetical protein
MTTIYDEARRRITAKIDGIQGRLRLDGKVAERAELLVQLTNYENLLQELERDFENTTPEKAAHKVLLGGPYTTGDASDESIINCLTVTTHA